MRRFALYFVPRPETQLAQDAALWLGRNENNVSFNQLKIKGITRQQFHALTRAPHHYGFHGTLKPPFRLQQGYTESELFTAIDLYCASRESFSIPSMEVRLIKDFLCLRPPRPCKEINQLARDMVIRFDHFRAPAGATELKKRKSTVLTPRQESLLLKWGYPYVMDEFRFHLTLSSTIEDEQEKRVLKQAAENHFTQSALHNIAVDGIALFVEQDGAPMTQQFFFPFSR